MSDLQDLKQDMKRFEVVSPYQPAGDQPEAIENLVTGIQSGLKEQVLLGVTGSGKTFRSRTASDAGIGA